MIVGRWALVDGEWVTAIPPFVEFGWNGPRFDAETAKFQRNPERYLAEHEIVQRLPKHTPAGSLPADAKRLPSVRVPDEQEQP